MAKIALAIGIGVAGALTGGLAWAGFLGFGIGGSALGAILGGAALGFSVGQAAGNILFPGHSSVTGPRLSDSVVSSSANGSPITRLKGGSRLAAQIIWSSGIKERKTTTTQSSKGSPSQTSTTYTYTCSFDAAFCESDGSANLSKIWGDSQLIYDTTSKGAVAADKLLTGIGSDTAIVVPAIHRGGPTQQPDPTEQAALGIDVTPAYRGLLRAVYTDFPLAQFGNRIPNIRAECSSGIVQSFLRDAFPAAGISDPYGSSPAFYLPAYVYLDQLGRAAIVLDEVGFVAERIDLSTDNRSPLSAWQAATAYVPGNQILDPNGNVQAVSTVTSDRKTGATIPTYTTGVGDVTSDHHVNWINVGAGPEAIAITSKGLIDPFLNPGETVEGLQTFPYCAGVDASGFLWIGVLIGRPVIGNIWYAVKVDPNTFQAVGRIPLVAPIISFNFVRSPSGGNQVCFTTSSSFTGGGMCYFVDGQTLTVRGKGSWVDTIEGLTEGVSFPCLDKNGVAYVAAFNTVNHHWSIVSLDPRSGGVVTRSFVFVSDATIGTPGSLVWNASDNSLIGLTETGYLIKIDVATMTIALTSSGKVLGTAGAAKDRFGKSFPCGQVPADGLIRFTADQTAHPLSIAIVSAIDLTVQSTPIDETQFFPGASAWAGITDLVYDVQTNSMIVCGLTSAYNSQSYRIFLERQNVAGEDLAQVVLEEMTLTGIDPSLLELSALEGTIVQGYPITRNTDAKSIIAILGQAYFFDIVESDNLLKAIVRGNAPVITIPESDLGLESENYAIQETEAQQHDLPREIEVVYSDPELDYEVGKQRRARPRRVVKTVTKAILEVPLTLEADAAAQLAAKALQIIWDERNQYLASLASPFYLTLDAADVFAFVYKGITFVGRITKTTSGQDYSLKLELASEDPRNYLSQATGTSGSGHVDQVIDPAAPTLLFLLDVPLLLDTDAPPAGSTGFYYAMTSPSRGWPGGVLFASADNETFNPIGFQNVGIEYGVVSHATPAPLRSPWTWDRDTKIAVRMAKGTLSSTTDLNVLNGANAFVLGGEVAQFRDADLQADGSYILSTLLRGRRGSDYFCNKHVTGETFIFLGAGGIGRNVAPTSLVGAARFYRGVTVGLTKDSALSQTFALTGADLKPYAPAHVRGIVDPATGDIAITWTRRTRVGGAWLDGIGDVPLAEDSESYDLDILVVREGAAGPLPEYVLTPAQPASWQIMTFGSGLGVTTAPAGIVQPFTLINNGQPVNYNGARDIVASPSVTWVTVYDPTRSGESPTVSLNYFFDSTDTRAMDPDYVFLGKVFMGVLPPGDATPGGTLAVIRSIKGLSSPAFTYPVADNAADFGTARTSIRIRIFQNSAAVGHGFAVVQKIGG